MAAAFLGISLKMTDLKKFLIYFNNPVFPMHIYFSLCFGYHISCYPVAEIYDFNSMLIFHAHISLYE